MVATIPGQKQPVPYRLQDQKAGATVIYPVSVEQHPLCTAMFIFSVYY